MAFSHKGSMLRALIQQGEGTQVEFKRTITHLPKIAKTITAFANNRGGAILIGVEDNKQIVGVNPEEESFMILQAARDWCYPPIAVRLSEQTHDGCTVLVVHVPESEDKPVKARNKENEWLTYVRTDDKCLIACKEVERALETQQESKAREQALKKLSRHEQAVFSYLQKAPRITPGDLAKLVNISRQRAAKLLGALMREGQLFAHNDHGAGRNMFYTIQ
jgi:predicted HTH transcriptional regulator